MKGGESLRGDRLTIRALDRREVKRAHYTSSSRPITHHPPLTTSPFNRYITNLIDAAVKKTDERALIL